jgi:cytochrome P460
MKKRSVFLAAATGALALLSMLACGQSPTLRGSRSPLPVDANGALHVPEKYRNTYEMLGTWAVMSQDGSSVGELHVVYASPGTVAAYRRNGRFPDDTVLVKEVFQASTSQMSTGRVGREGELKGWFVMVKDSANPHPGNPLWGDGWGWSWFDAGNPTETTSTDYHKDCLGCHTPAKASDWVYVQGYPALQPGWDPLSRR